jgi:hypothetical protein
MGCYPGLYNHLFGDQGPCWFAPEVVKGMTMQAVEEFMREFRDEQVALEKQEQARRLSFLQRFYADSCVWGKRAGRLEMAQSLKVLSILSTATTAEVIMSRLANGEPDLYCEVRYRLEAHGQSWRICGVDVRCCCGDGESADGGCPSCHGIGWRDTNVALATAARGDARTSERMRLDAELARCSEPGEDVLLSHSTSAAPGR